MIMFKAVLLCAVLASSVAASSIKGYAATVQQEEQHAEQRIEQQVSQKIEQSEQSQQIELKEEQHKVEEAPAWVEQEHIQQQQVTLGTKGAAPAAPLAEAEPYAFSYQVEGSSRSESGDTKGVVRGQYTLQGADGASRVVDYIADHNGFRASINTNEFGTESKSPAGINLRTSQPTAEEITLKLEGKTREDLAAQVPLAAPAGIKGAAPSIKGAPATPAVQLPLELPEAPKKTIEQPAKGQRLRAPEELPQQQEQQSEPQQLPEQPIKSAEVRAPKALGEQKSAPQQTRSGFESATSHRAYRSQASAPALAAPAAPAKSAKRPPQAPPAVVRAPAPVVSRAYLQRERYPPSPVQAGGRRVVSRDYQQAELPQRVSFYSPSTSFDEEHPSFDPAQES